MTKLFFSFFFNLTIFFLLSVRRQSPFKLLPRIRMAKRLAVRRKTAIHRKSIYAELSTEKTKSIRFFLRKTIEDNVQNKINWAKNWRYDTWVSLLPKSESSSRLITKVKVNFFKQSYYKIYLTDKIPFTKNFYLSFRCK